MTSAAQGPERTSDPAGRRNLEHEPPGGSGHGRPEHPAHPGHPDEPGDPREPGHEHPESFFPERVVDPHRFLVIRTAVAAALQDDRARLDAYERAIAALEIRFRELDEIIDNGRWMLFGNARAATFFHEWILARASDDPPRTHAGTHAGMERSAGREPDAPPGEHADAHAPALVGGGAGHPGEGDAGGGVPPIPGVLNWEPVLDLFIEAAYSAGVNQDLRRQRVTIVSDLVSELGSLVGPLHHFAKDHLEGRGRPGELLQLLDALSKGNPFPPFPGEHDECRMALQGVLMSSGSALARSMEAIEIDGNTDRITQVDPDQICVPGQVRVLASTAVKFDAAQPPGVGVYGNGTMGTIDAWSDVEVRATFPEQASTGHVYFQKIPQASPEIGSSIVEDMQALSACPMFAGAAIGRGSALASAYVGLPHTIHPMRHPDHRRPETFLTVRHKPVIVLFTARDENGHQISGINAAQACSKVRIQWSVLSDDPAPPHVDIFEQGAVRFSGLLATGTLTIYPDRYQRLTMRAQNGCGVTTRDLDLQVRRPVLRVAERLTVRKGGQAVLSFSFSCPVVSATTVTLMSSDTSKATVTPSVTVSAGSSQGQATVTGVASGKAEQATATVTLTAPSYASREVDVWVENPLGEWAVVKDPANPAQDLELPLVAIHAALLRTGKVLFFAGDENDPNRLDTVKMVLWDPRTGGYTDIAATMPAPRNLFCAGHAFLADGRLLVAAGHAHSPLQNLSEEVIGAIIGGIVTGGLGGVISGALVGTAVGRGVDHDIHVYDPVKNSWTRHRDMDKARWYPSCVTLPDGRILIVSGYCAGAPPHPFTLFGAPVNEDYDLFDPATGDLVAIKNPGFLPGIDLYPRLIVLPGGALFVHSRNRTVLFYPDANAAAPLHMTKSPNEYLTASPNRRTYPLQGACVLLPLIPEKPNEVRILAVGGGNEQNTTISWTNQATDTSEIFDFNPAFSAARKQTGWRDKRADGASLRTALRRFMSDAVLLPDRTLLLVGGAGVGRDDFNSSPVFEAASFDSEAELWRAMAASTVERRYHATALLLPDGRVVSAGSSGGWPGPPWETPHPVSHQYRLEVFTPPYLFRGPRPQITSPGSFKWSYGTAASIGTDEPAEIGSVALIRTGSATHTTDMDQRYVGLEITFRGTDWVTVRTPKDATIAPPGCTCSSSSGARRSPSGSPRPPGSWSFGRRHGSTELIGDEPPGAVCAQGSVERSARVAIGRSAGTQLAQ